MDQCCHLEVDEASFVPKMFSGDREGAGGRQARGRGCVAGALQQDLPGRRRRHQVSWHKSRTCINQMAVNCTFITEKVQIVANAKKNLQACINKFVSAGSFYKSRLSRSNFKLKNLVLKSENKHEHIFSLKHSIPLFSGAPWTSRFKRAAAPSSRPTGPRSARVRSTSSLRTGWSSRSGSELGDKYLWKKCSICTR